MASIKLNKAIRDGIIKKLLIHKFQVEVDRLIKDQAELAEQLYNHVYTPKDRERIEALPGGWLPRVEKIKIAVGVGHEYYDVCFNGRMGIWAELSKVSSKSGDDDRVSRPVAYRHKNNVAFVLERSHKYAKALLDHESRRERLTEQIRHATLSAEAALGSVSTISSLVKNWPEVEPFTRDYKDGGVNLPALPTKQLNELLGLPVQEAA